MSTCRSACLLATVLLCGCTVAAVAPYPESAGVVPGQSPVQLAQATEVVGRVEHRRQPVPPGIVAERGNLWPPAPAPVLTMRDMQVTAGSLGAPAVPLAVRRHRGGYGLCQPIAPSDHHAVEPPGFALGLCSAPRA